MAVSRRKDKTGRVIGWQVVIDRTWEGGRQRRTVGTYKTKKEALSAERKALDELDRGTFIDPSTATVKDALDLWLKAKAEHVTPNTMVDYEAAARLHITPALGHVKIQKLTSAAVQVQYSAWREAHQAYTSAMVTWREAVSRWESAGRMGPMPPRPDGDQGLGRRMVQRCHLVLSQALDSAVRFGLVGRNVAREVKVPAVEHQEMQVWSPEETAAFLDVARKDNWAPLWFLLALEGMRRGEALGLRWRDITWERGTAHISQTVIHDHANKGKATIKPSAKTKAGARTVRLTRQTLEVLRKHRDSQRFAGRDVTEGLVLCTGTGSPVNPANVARAYLRLVILSGVPEIRVHDMRHTAISNMLRLGIPASVVKEKAGHASISVTVDRYGHLGEQAQDEAAERISDLMDRYASG